MFPPWLAVMAQKARGIENLPGPRWLWLWLLFISMVGSYVGLMLALDLPLINDGDVDALPLETGFWAAIITSALTCFGLLMSGSRSGNGVRKALARLPFSNGEADQAALEAAVSAKRADLHFIGWSRKMFIGGMVSGVLFSVVGIGMTIPVDTLYERVGHAAWYAAVLPFVFGMVGRNYYQTLFLNGVTLREAAARVEVDLFDPAPLRPFAQIALRQSLQWSVFLAAMSAITYAPAISVYSMSPLLLGGIFITLISFIMPLRAIHGRMVAEKQSGIQRAGAAIAQARLALDQGDANAAARLSAELAWRGALQHAHEWPLDLGTVTRLLLYLGIPIGGWIGSALVEQGLDKVL